MINEGKRLKDYFSRQDDIIAAYLFGSFAIAKENRHSDIDVAVLFNSGLDEKKYTDRQITIMNDMTNILNRQADVVVLNRAGAFLKYQVYKNAKTIFKRYDRQPRLFKARSILEYFDFLPVRNYMEAALIKAVKED